MNTNCGIYIIQNMVDFKVYVGSSISLKIRKRTHWHLLKRGTHHNTHLQNAYSKYIKEFGDGVWIFEVVEYCNEIDLVYWEDYWMEIFDSRNPKRGYNLVSADRQKVSESTRAKMSATRKGTKPPGFAGRKHTPDSLARMSTSQKGKTVSEETRAKLSAALKGKPNPALKGKPLSEEHKEKLRKPKSEEHKAKLSASKKGKPGRLWTEASKEKMRGPNNHFFGKPHTEEVLKKISDGLKGKPAWNKGLTLTEEQKAQLPLREGKKGEENGNSKLTRGEVAEIRNLLSLGYKHRDLAKMFGVGKTTITHINKGDTWQ